MTKIVAWDVKPNNNHYYYFYYYYYFFIIIIYYYYYFFIFFLQFCYSFVEVHFTGKMEMKLVKKTGTNVQSVNMCDLTQGYCVHTQSLVEQ